MQEIKLWEGSTCPLCETQGINSKLKFFRLNLRVAALLCKQKKCPFPVSTNYPDTFVRVGRDGNIIPGSQSEKGWTHEEEDDSDDSPYISDASEESVTFPDDVSEVKNVHSISSENTNETGALEVDAFDISSIDFETDDSMDTFKLRNEITSLEMEITQSVENMKSEPPHGNFKGSSDDNSEKCKDSGSVKEKSFISSDDNVCTDTHRELDITDSSCTKMNENGAECCSDKKSSNIILHEHDSPSSIPESLELPKMTEELVNNVQQPEADTPISNNNISNHNPADIQNNSNKNCQGGGCSDDVNHGGHLEGVKSIGNGNCSDNNVEKQFDTISIADTLNPKPEQTLLLNSQSTKNTVADCLPRKDELHAELDSSELVTCKKYNDSGKKKCDNKEMDIIFDERTKSYKIVAVDSDSNTGFLGDSSSYEVINLEISFCKSPKSSGGIAGRKTKVHQRAENTVEQYGKKRSVDCSNSGSVTSVKLKVVEEDGLFVCTQNNSPSSVSEVEEAKQPQKKSPRNKVHSKNCVCFLCKESNKKGITSHLDRALADLFPEEYTIVENLPERELPSEREIIRDFVHYMTGNNKRSPKKRKRLFHL